MSKNLSPEHFQNLDQQLRRLVKEMIDQIQAEIKRLDENPSASSGNAALYTELGKKAAFIKDQAVSPDFTIALEEAMQRLKKVEDLASRLAKNEEILVILKKIHADLHECRNIRG